MKRPAKISPAASSDSNKPAPLKKSAERKEHPGSSLIGDESYNPWTFDFTSPELNNELMRWFRATKMKRSTLNGQFVYNAFALPAFIYHDIYKKSELLSGKFGTTGQVFLCSVLLVHVLFFLFYYYETRGDWAPNMTEKERVINADRRIAVANMFVVVGPTACGLVMNSEVAFKYCFPSFVEGMVPMEPLLIGAFLSVYHHYHYPVPWCVVIAAWGSLLVLIVLSWAPSASPTSFVSNVVLTLCFAASLALNHRIHAGKVAAFLAERRARLSSEERRAKSFRLQKTQEVIGEYLAQEYRRVDGLEAPHHPASVQSQTEISALTPSSSSGGNERTAIVRAIATVDGPPVVPKLARERSLF